MCDATVTHTVLLRLLIKPPDASVATDISAVFFVTADTPAAIPTVSVTADIPVAFITADIPPDLSPAVVTANILAASIFFFSFFSSLGRLGDDGG